MYVSCCNISFSFFIHTKGYVYTFVFHRLKSRIMCFPQTRNSIDAIENSDAKIPTSPKNR